MKYKNSLLDGHIEQQFHEMHAKILEDDRAREMATSLKRVELGRCTELEVFGCADECFKMMSDEFQEYCAFLMENETSAARQIWKNLLLDEKILLTLNGVTDIEH